jgi:hypothetical protein
MYKSAYQEITQAIETIKGGYKKLRSRKSCYRSTNRQWDRIIRTLCTGCGKPLGRYENQKRLAFCFECRRILFPDTINPKESWRKPKFQGWA